MTGNGEQRCKVELESMCYKVAWVTHGCRGWHLSCFVVLSVVHTCSQHAMLRWSLMPWELIIAHTHTHAHVYTCHRLHEHWLVLYFAYVYLVAHALLGGDKLPTTTTALYPLIIRMVECINFNRAIFSLTQLLRKELLSRMQRVVFPLRSQSKHIRSRLTPHILPAAVKVLWVVWHVERVLVVISRDSAIE